MEQERIFDRSVFMAPIIRDVTPEDMPSVTSIYANAVLHETASYELEPPVLDEMRARFTAITSKGYPYIAAVDETDLFLGYAYASAFRTRPGYRWLVEDSVYVSKTARGLGVGKARSAMRGAGFPPDGRRCRSCERSVGRSAPLLRFFLRWPAQWYRIQARPLARHHIYAETFG